jgi:phosphate/sulfate permease
VIELKSKTDTLTDTEEESEECYILDLEREAYRFLLIISACLVCLAHGSNDVANSIAPLLVVLSLTTENLVWAYWLGGAGIALGLLTLGYKVMVTVGKNVIKLDFYKGYSCQFATAICIILGTRLGIPLSTTHCMVGSLFGIVIANKTSSVIATYRTVAMKQ